MSSLSRLSCSRFFSRALSKCTIVFTPASRASSTTGITGSPPPGARRPSFYFFAVSLALAASAFLALSPASTADEWPARLLERGWSALSSAPCPDLKPQAFYELDSESGNAELYTGNGRELFLSRTVLPAEPPTCHEIPAPSFIEEIL